MEGAVLPAANGALSFAQFHPTAAVLGLPASLLLLLSTALLCRRPVGKLKEPSPPLSQSDEAKSDKGKRGEAESGDIPGSSESASTTNGTTTVDRGEGIENNKTTAAKTKKDDEDEEDEDKSVADLLQ